MARKKSTTPIPDGKPSKGEKELKDLKGWVNDEQIEAWKKEHKCKEIPALSDGDSIIYFRKPTRKDLGLAKQWRREGDEYDEATALATAICIGGDKTMMDDEQNMVAICEYMMQMHLGNNLWVLNH